MCIPKVPPYFKQETDYQIVWGDGFIIVIKNRFREGDIRRVVLSLGILGALPKLGQNLLTWTVWVA